MSRGHIAFVDDEPDLCAAAADWLEASDFTVETWSDPGAALAAIEPARFDVVLTDLRMPGVPGDRLMAALRDRDPDLPVILMSAHADVPAAVAAMRDGAHHFIEKPYLAEYLVAVLERAVEWRRLRREATLARTLPAGGRGLEQRIPGRSAAIRRLRDAVAQIADAPVDVLLHGAPGTGGEAIARVIHDLSQRARRPFIVLDCAALPEAALETELFGHDRGSTAERPGRFEIAQGGTLCLTGFEGLSPALQARLFRVLQDRAVLRAGGQTPRPVDVRLIAVATADLAARRQAGLLRDDLWFRLASAALHLPALTERPEDIAPLYTLFLAEAARRFRRPQPEPGPAELEALRLQPWPGDLAQLQTQAERLVLGLREEPRAARPTAEDQRPLPERVAEFESQAIARALEQADGSSAAAAELLGLPRRTLNEKIARYSLRAGSGRRS